ncbi:ubiquitin carboxyl-terminal hydrolase 2 [Metarhizium album ARSEF 1941]|uniref:Ubiquitin carboxyl-terminal hydrolase 2 n=1 Tax=Metarhizium album (strain ARSEF 1941) TaxID=1081103 RepID=A0A0B2X8H1_METAS|nr:ubiquitin carboxyl-terminal hydrolase 2 [Metarhizium album ARSEF 1941]KHO01815.1 ubiquitin carboxyl-terminal hydrolase 2 [Metarhizium album ARSEF 1941]
MPVGGFHARNGASSRLPQPSAAPFPHINDVVSVPRDINSNQSIKKLLEQAESCFRQSELHRDFNRPAIALKDYVRASVIAVDVIRRHPDYPDMTSQQWDASLLHKALLSKINRQSEIYNQIKQDIIADNRRTGVQPGAQSSLVVTTANGLSRNLLPNTSNTEVRPIQKEEEWRRQQNLPHGHVPQPPTGGQPSKSKPTTNPKPAALHGNAIPPLHNRTMSANNVTLDLAARFANLRGPQPSPGQDPRIKTYPIIPQKPAGPREMPPSPSKIDTNLSCDTALPKPPDAIYSPVRGTVSGEAARLPTSTPRGLFSRKGSTASVLGTSSTNQPRQSEEYFPLVLPSSTKAPEVAEKVLKIPQGNTITPRELITVREAKASILYIDVRPREDFDDGHIMAVSIICIEPNILGRGDVTCSDISEALVLSPPAELTLFEKRHSYDLVVFYDQDSDSFPKSDRDPCGAALWSLNRALVELSYDKELKNSPKLLKGGIHAWTDLYGAGSLRSTPAADVRMQARTSKRHPLIQRRGSKYVFNPLPEKDVETFRKGLEKDAAPPSFPRTKDEFLRFPPVSQEQQSMSSGVCVDQQFKHDFASGFGSPAQMLTPPTRPQAAVQRPSHISLSEDSHDSHEVAEQIPAIPAKVQTGLNNPGNWCYANSILQSLLASPNFGREIADSEWARRYKNQVPRKSGEKMDQPQLMIQMLSNIFYWMSSGKFQTMKAQMLMDYSRHLCATGDPKTKFGGKDQQDAQEFMSFLMDQLHDETNLRRGQQGTVDQPSVQGLPLVQAAERYWENHKRLNDSIVDQYWRGLQLSTVKCHHCATRTYTFSQFESLGVNVSGDRNVTLSEALRQANTGDEIDDFRCNCCGTSRPAKISESLARMPPLLCVSFRRFQVNGRGVVKSTAEVTWDFNDFDFTPYFLNSTEDWQGASTHDRAFCGPFRYQCYAVIVHSGRSIDSGHYYAYVRDSSTHDPYAWHCCNDSVVTKVRIGSREPADMQNTVFRSGSDAVPYLAFFRRKSD